MTRVQIATLGCKVNAYDAATIADRLRAAGCEIVAAGAPADVVIVNSCTVTDTADAESRGLARRARREHPAARVVLTGCYAQTRPTEAAGEPAVDHVIGLNRLDSLVAAGTAPLPAVARIVVGHARRGRTVSTFGARTFAGQTRAFLKVQEGCDLFCTFCIIPMARGASRSLPPRDVLAEVAALAREGFEEVVLTGVHLGGYGRDLSPPVDLAWLVAALAEQGLVPRRRLSSIDPHEVTETRARRLRGAGERKRAAFARRFDGAEAEVLVETTRDPASGALRGYTRNYLRARLVGPDAWRGRRLRARLAVGPAGQVTAAVGAEE